MMDVQEKDRLPRQLDGNPISASPFIRSPDSVPRAAVRRRPLAVRAFMGLPLFVLGTMAAIALANRQPVPSAGPQVDLRTPGRSVTALAFGAGSGIHLLRISDEPRPVRADLARGALHVIALGVVELRAANLGDSGTVRLMARGPVLELRQDGARVAVRTGF